MAAKGMSRRHIKKAVVRQMEKDFEIQRFNYKELVRRVKGKSKLIGISVAAIIYMIGVGGGYYGWLTGFVPEEVMAKVVFIAMVPSSVVGAVVWMIMDSRLEYPIRAELRRYIENVEGPEGRLWRYAPIAEQLTIKGVDIPSVISMSKSGRAKDIDPQDYSLIVTRLYEEVMSNEGLQLTSEGSKSLEEQLLNVNSAT